MSPNAVMRGRYGEHTAVRFLEQRGYAILERNFRAMRAEIDLIARDRDHTLVFVEVKLRTSTWGGRGYEHVGRYKQQRILKAASAYISSKKLGMNRIRFDVISIDVDQEKVKILHLRNAFP